MKVVSRSTIAVGMLSASIACGGGPIPSEVSHVGVHFASKQPRKRQILRDARLNLVKKIVPIGDDEFYVVGNQLACTVTLSGTVRDCATFAVDLWRLDVLRDAAGMPSMIVGAGGWGKPSVAVLDSRGKLKWRFDGGFDVMGNPFVVDTPRGGVVAIQGKTFDLPSGTPLNLPNCGCGAIGSGDFNGDGRRELLASDHGDLSIVDGDGHGLRHVQIGADHWEEPIVIGTATPSVVVSKREELVVYDRQLNLSRSFHSPGAPLPFHASAAVFRAGDSGPFAALVVGRGGWHRTFLFVYSEHDDLIYQQILDDDYGSIEAYKTKADGFAFVVGGRNEIWSYEFAE